MSTKLKAGTATSGAVIDADATGILELQSGSTPTTAVTVDASQNVGIGTASPTQKLNVNSSTATGYAHFTNTTTGNSSGFAGTIVGNDNGDGLLWNAYNGNLKFATGNTERMRIDSSGRVGIGSGTTNARLWVVGSDSTSSNWSIYAANSNATIQFGLRNDNFLYAPSVANYATSGSTVVLAGSYLGYLSSSVRFKKDVVDYDKGLSEVIKLRPVYYRASKPNQDGEYDERTYAGFIAEEVKKIGLEEYIDYDHEGEVTSLKYGQMTAILCKAIQELNAKVDAQAAEIAALKGAK